MPEIIADNISIVETNEVEGATRLEAEYYNKPSLINKNFIKGEKIIDYVQYGTSEDLNEEFNGYPVLRLNEFDGSFIGAPSKYCNKISNGVFYKLLLKKGDILVCRTNGNPKLVGKSALVMEDANIAFASYLFRVRPKPSVINSTTLSVYLNSRIGRREIERNLMVSNQANFSPAKFRDIKVPLFPAEFQVIIDKIVANAYHNHKRSKLLYSQAESLLLEELGIKDIGLSHEPCYEVNSADTINYNRIDAEYYQPKYERVIEAIKKHDHKEFWKIAFVDKTANPPYSKQKEIPIITQKHLGYYQIDEEFLVDPETEYTTAQFTKQYSKYVLQKEDILLYSVGAYIGKANIFNLDIKAVSGSFLTIIRIDKTIINPYYLLAVLNSLTGISQSKRHSKATAQQYLYPADIRKFVIPILKKTIQEEIGQFIVDANYACRQAKELLEEAKKKVEEMIEKG